MSAAVDLSDAVRFRLHRGQAQVYRSPARFRVVVAGRRWGKTTVAVTELVTRALRGEPGRYWYVGPDRTNAKDTIWQQLKDMIDPTWLTRQPMETELIVDLVGGSQIAVKGAEEPDRLRGRGLRFAVLDEFADMKPETWTAVLRPQLADYGASALFIGTPKSYNHLYDLYVRGQDQARTTWASWQFRTRDNPFIDPKEIEDAKADTDERTFRQEWEASFEALAGRAYYAFTRLDHVRAVDLDPNLPVCISADFNLEPSSAVIGQRIGDHLRIWREVQTRHAGGEATRATAERARQLLQDAHWTGPIRLYGDATGRAGKTTGPSDHAVLRETFPGAVWLIGAANPHVRDRVAAVNGRCRNMKGEQHLTIDPTCQKLLADLEQVVFQDNGELDKKSNPALTHLSDSLGYLCAREWPPSKRLVDARMFAGVDL